MPSYQKTLLAAVFHAFAFVTTSNAAIDLGSAATYGVLGASDVTNTGVTTIDGSVGVYPGTSITGFPPGVATGVYSYGDPAAAAAQADAATAYGAATGSPCGTDLSGEDLGGMVLAPGVYCFATSAELTGVLTLDAGGSSNAQWVFQIGTTLNTATGSAVLLINGAQPCGVTWAVGSSATIGTGTAFAGDIIAMASISVDTDVTNQGGLYALTGGVTLIMDTISISATGCTVVVTTPTASVTPLLKQHYIKHFKHVQYRVQHHIKHFKHVQYSVQHHIKHIKHLINSSFNNTLNALLLDPFLILDALNALLLDPFLILDTLLDSLLILDLVFYSFFYSFLNPLLNDLVFYSFIYPFLNPLPNESLFYSFLNPLLNSPYYHNKHPWLGTLAMARTPVVDWDLWVYWMVKYITKVKGIGDPRYLSYKSAWE
uniref:Ice-binding protein n=1 Tax=Cladonia uncialis subsp. uncialis TaxID=180999 RepID=A0A2K9YEJ7_CLAUC|nr:hypothetical protein [Cladonia uncialis subsp. uncialis]